MATKESFEDVYDQARPHPYYMRYAETRLSIVEYIAALLRLTTDAGYSRRPVVDFGCGYGTLGALLRTGLGIEELYTTYLKGSEVAVDPSPEWEPRLIGVDRSRPALSSASTHGLIDEAVEMDLNDPRFKWAGDARPIVTCSAMLGYVRPRALRRAIEQLETPLALVTCVTWVIGDLVTAFDGCAYRLVQLTDDPIFQRWATPRERRDMPELLIDDAHRAHCFAVSRDHGIDWTPFRLCIETVRARRARSAWLAAGRATGCELPGAIDRPGRSLGG